MNENINTPREKKWPIIEIFGPTIQGEGSMTGVPTHFIRFGGCGYRCSWCDTPYAVLPEEIKKNRTMMTQDEILSNVVSLGKAPWVTLSGGDPCLHQGLAPLIRSLKENGFQTAVETQGQYFREWLNIVDQITISPKPPSSGEEGRLDKDVILNIMSHQESRWISVCLKFVVKNTVDLDWVYKEFCDDPRFMHVPIYLQPCSPSMVGDNNEDDALNVVKALDWLAGAVLQMEQYVQKYYGARKPKTFLNRSAGLYVGVQLHRLMFLGKDKGV